MINDETTHWAGQQDRVDDFVFQRLSSEEMDTYKRHLEKCAHCALLVQNEQQLIKGIKRYGRSQLKSRLQEQISKQDFSHIEWKRFVSIAAVIILVSTSAAYFFFLTHNHNANSRSREIVLQEQHQSLWLIGKVVIKNEPFHGKLAKDNWTFRLRRENSSGVLH
ncbi:MAG TPA: hypothetical protein VMU30_08125, partial [Bacteroidota bacterium]|nr:hypothetical protein [Bacteroidota bacterium]